MLKPTRTYKDYNGVSCMEDFYFNLTQAEVTELELSVDGGPVEMINRIVAAQDGKRIITVLKDIILRTYGEKSPDEKRFIKNQELWDASVQTEVYSDLFMELTTDTEAAAWFISGIIPQGEKAPASSGSPAPQAQGRLGRPETLELVIPGTERYNEANDRFTTIKKQAPRPEHSLVSLSEWESKWHKPYLSRRPKTWEERIDYVRCMTLIQNVNPDVYIAITPQMLETVDAYINDSMTTTIFTKGRKGRSANEVVTTEVIYYWMLSHQILFKCQKRRLNRLMTLINICNAKNGPQGKMSQKEISAQNRAPNAAHRERTNSRGRRTCPK